MSPISFKVENLFQLKVTVNNEAEQYAFYFYRGKELLEKSHYSRQPSRTFFMDKPGLYRVRVFWRGVIEGSGYTDNIRFDGLVNIPLATENDPIVVCGVSKIAAFVYKVFEVNNEVTGFLDHTGRLSGQFFSVDKS